MSGAVPEERAVPRVEIARGNPTEEDLAALAAVIPAAYVQEAAASTVEDPPVDAWTRSRRMRRTPVPGARWGRFAG